MTSGKENKTGTIKFNPHGKINGKPNPVDVHIGERIRLRRAILGLSQQNLASMLGVTYQQVQKYEKGGNRIGASRLFDFARALNTTPNYFFDDMDDKTKSQSPMSIMMEHSDKMFLEEDKIETIDVMKKKETLELVKAYYGISKPMISKSILLLIKVLDKTLKNVTYENEELEQGINSLLKL